MKTSQLILIFCIIGYCFPDIDDICVTKFAELVKKKCEDIGSCTFSADDDRNFCILTTDSCESASLLNCPSTVPTNFHTEKCIVDSSATPSRCKKVLKTCNDYNKIASSHNINNGDDCSQLSAGTDKYCFLRSGSCIEQFEDCGDITPASRTDSACTSNVPKQHSQKCEIGTNEGNYICKVGERSCSESIYKDKSNCNVLKPSDSNKYKCIYISSIEDCREKYISCDLIETGGDENVCEYHSPLNNEGNDFDYTKKCTHNTAITNAVKCKAEARKCKDYNSPITVPTELIDDEFCQQLEVSENYYRCAYDGNGRCYEEYKNCENYTSYKVETDRNNCEEIVLENKNEKCVYDKKEDKCVTKKIYQNCGEYKGTDKQICESILSSENKKYCILDKDSECIEKPINCSEAYTKDDCLYIAKPSDSNKRCVFGSKSSAGSTSPTGTCYEEFLRCEDYFEESSYGSQSCRYIKLYNGQACKSISGGTNNINRCISKFKTCEEATTKEECKLITKTGVSDPERKVCDWYGNRCIENYKYCSDYRGDNTDNKCTRIKPYDASGNNIDYGFKCSYAESEVGCQKVRVECEDAKNPVECLSFNEYIKDKEKQHCVYYGDECTTQYRQCEFVDLDKVSSKCSTNIIEGYIINACAPGSDSKCERKDNRCTAFTKPKDFTPSTPDGMDKFYMELCKSIDSSCAYKDSGNCIFEEKSCEDILFYSNDTEKNKELCENTKVDKPYKKCTLKEDFSGCEEVYLESDYSTASISYSTSPDASSQGNSSDFISKGIHLIITLLCLLI